MVEVSSADVAEMFDSSVADFIADINAKRAQLPLGPTLGLISAAVGIGAIAAADGPASILSTLGAITLLSVLPLWGIGAWVDQSYRRSVLFYNLSNEEAAKFERVTAAFDELSKCNGKWHIKSGGAVRDLRTWKRNAGAGHIVERQNANLAYNLPKILKSNITPPTLRLGRNTLYFFPEIALMEQGRKFGAVSYGDLKINFQTSQFIEDQRPPVDAQIVGETWQHPNKSGGPDRRFKQNRRIPVCLYETMHLFSQSGINEIAEFSRVGVVKAFAVALRSLPSKPGRESFPSITTTVS